MDYNCRDELIIMLVVATMKKVTAGQSSADLCLLKTLIIKLERVTREVRCGPVVIRWSLCNSVQHSLDTDLQLYKDLWELDLIYINKQKVYTTDFFYNLKDRGQALFSEQMYVL